MFENDLKEFEFISKAVGESIDLVQGGGGNTSVKLNDELMAVKASGFKLKDINPTNGYVVVNYKNIKDYYENVDLNSNTDFEKESVEVAKNNIVEMEGLKVLRPSVEAGFHSILKKFVIHTHPVYANILCCSEEGKGIVDKIFKGKEYETVWVPYINPGFHLTLVMKDKIDQCIEKTGKFPQVIFMENHGLVVTADGSEACVKLHEEVNGLIREYLDIVEEYPELSLNKIDDNTFISSTEYIKDFFKGTNIEEDFFSEISLYPDQLVYLNSNLAFKEGENKLFVNRETGELVYKTNYNEALTIEETLLGFVYVVNTINKKKLQIKTMSEEGKSFIDNWESEKYRKSLLKDK